MQFSLIRGLGLVLASATLAACGDQPQSPVDASSAPARQSASAQPGWTIDDEFERIAREEVPGFAGDYLLPDGTPVVLLVDPSQRAAAARSVAARRARAGMPPRGIQVRAARFDFPTLRQWRDQLFPLMDADQAFAMDVDEAQNRIWVAVESAGGGASVRAEAARLGIPASALVVEVQQKPQPRATLRESSRPVLGGVQIVSGTGSTCTLGFNALMNGAPVFVTNSHCSGTQWRLDTVPQRQPVNDAGNEIGYETRDKGSVNCQFGTGLMPCRRSDSSIYGFNPGVPHTLGQIARPLYYGANQAGSLEIDPLNPYFQITAKNTTGLSVGTWVDKVGRTSGWTRGQVEKSCVWLKSTFYLECQYVSSTWSQPGDSGSPMFVVGSGITLHGLLWGGPENDWTTTWYSPVGGVETDFGVTLQVF